MTSSALLQVLLELRLRFSDSSAAEPELGATRCQSGSRFPGDIHQLGEGRRQRKAERVGERRTELRLAVFLADTVVRQIAEVFLLGWTT